MGDIRRPSVRELLDNVSSYTGDVLSNGNTTIDDYTSLTDVLAGLVTEYATAVYNDVEVLYSQLLQHGIDSRTALKVCLVTKATGFGGLLNAAPSVRQTSIDRVVNNVQTESGLNRFEIAGIMRSILHSLGIACDIEPSLLREDNFLAESAYTIPSSYYEHDVHMVKVAVGEAVRKKGQVSRDTIHILEPLVAAGIPKAKYLMGYCMLNGLSGERATETGVKLLTEAFYAGDTEAAAALGDYYYDLGAKESISDQVFEDDAKLSEISAAQQFRIMRRMDSWTKALSYYTGIGSMALNAKRKRQVVDIFNHGLFNASTLRLCVPLLAAMVASVVLMPGASVYATHWPLGVVCIALCVAIYVRSLLYSRRYPYTDTIYAPTVLFMPWALFMAIRLFFF